MHQRFVARDNPQRVGTAQGAAVGRGNADRQFAGLRHGKSGNEGGEGAAFERDRLRQSLDRHGTLQRQSRVDEIGRIAPFIVGLDGKAERFAGADLRRQNRVPAQRRSGNDGDFRTFRQRDIVISGDRIGEDAKFEFALAIGLQPDPRRAEAAIAEADRNGVARRQEMLDHADIERAAPRTDVALKFPFAFQRRAVRRLDAGVAGAFRIVELHRPEIGGKPKSDLERTGIVTPKAPAV